VANAALTAAQWNASVRDNFLMTAPALATAAGTLFAGTGANTIAQRIPGVSLLSVAENTASTTYVALATAGPTVTVTSGTNVFIFIGAHYSNGTGGSGSRMSYAVSGATTIAAADDISVGGIPPTSGFTHASTATLLSGLTLGSNTFTSMYKATTGGSASFTFRRLAILPL
jgi:hypothetical protein